MARAGGSSKFVPVNLNKSYGQPLPLSNGSASASVGLSRSRSSGSSHGGMVSLSRSSRVSSSSITLPTSSRASKLAVPRPVNLPSLRREHAGNDPTVALVGSSGSSGWTKQAGEETLDSAAVRSDALTSDSTWGNPSVFQGSSAPVSDGANQNAEGKVSFFQAPVERPSIYTPPGSCIATTHGISASAHISPVEKAVVFRGEDFPTLQAVAVPPSPSVPPQQRQRDLQLKQREKLYEVRDQQKKMQQLSQQQQQQNQTEDVPHSEHLSGPQLQLDQPMRPQRKATLENDLHFYRGTLSEQADTGAERSGGHSRGPSPLIRLTHTSNWADDERETLSSFRPPQGRAQSDWVELGRSSDGYRSADSWAVDHSGNIDFRHPTPRNGYLGRNDSDSVMHAGFVSKVGYGKEGDDFANGGRFELDYRGDTNRLSSGLARNTFLKRGWSFSATESNYNRDARFGNSNNGNGRDRDTNAKVVIRDGNMLKNDPSGWEISSRDAGLGSHLRDVQENKFGKDAFLGKQGLSGGRGSQGDRIGRGNGFLYGGSEATIPSNSRSGTIGRQDLIGLDYGREKRASVFHGQLRNEDPFLGDIISTRASSFFGTFGLDANGLRQKKDTSKDDDLRDPARESFEAELERVQKMLEQERQRVVEERERSIELARKEQEEQERLAREEEQLRLQLEEEAREATARAQREAEEAARKTEDERRAREDEKRTIVLEEERRKESARRKLLELEERMAKRESERRRDYALQKERGHTVILAKEEVSMQSHDNGRRNGEMDWEYQGKFVPNSGKVEQDDDERAPFKAGLPSQSPPADPSPLPSLLKSPSLLPYVKEGHGFSTERTRPLQMWKREALDNRHGLSSASKSSPKSSLPQDDLPQLDREQQQRRFSFRDLNLGAPRNSILTDTQERVPIDNPNDREAGNWWGRDNPSRSQPPLGAHLHGADAADYPSFGRLRQSLPKPPRVLPPPPGQATLHKQAFQTKSLAPVTGSDGSEVAPKSEEEFTLRSGCDHETSNEDSVLSDVQVSKQFDSAPSEEVVLSDAGSQFSDDTVEDASTPAIQPYQEIDVHSDVVSETCSEEVDEIFDLTEAQESSEEVETEMPTNLQVPKGEEPSDNSEEGVAQARKDDMHCCLQVQNEVEEEDPKVVDEEDKVIQKEDKVIEEDENGVKHTRSRYLTEDLAVVNIEKQTHEDEDHECALEETEKPADLQPEDATEFVPKDGQPLEGDSKDLAAEKVVEDQVVQPLLYQPPFLSVSAMDAAQMGHSEGLSSRQSLVQQFQQPFSFMAVPLPQSSTLNNVAANPSMLSSVHGLQNQQELPFHLQLGLLPGVPLMPNAIQIGSIQMPLHIHPQIPQLTHLHGQQPPVFQFGQIGQSVPISQPLPMMQPAVQIHHALGQHIFSQHHQSQAEPFSVTDTPNGLVSSDQLPKMGDDVAVQNAMVSSAGHNPAVDRCVEISQLASRSSGGSASKVEWKDQVHFVAPEAKAAAVLVSKPGISVDQAGKKTTVEKFGSPYGGRIGDSGQADQNAWSGGRPPPRGRRRNNGPRYHGILGRGRGRFHAGQNYGYQAPHLAAETWPESGTKGVARGKMFRRNFVRAEYRVREPLPRLDGESAALEMPRALGLGLSNMEEAKESGGYRYVKRETGSHSRSLGDENRQNVRAGSRPMHAAAKGDRPGGQNRLAIKGKYEADSAEDAPLRTGVVCVFEQPGIETRNDKDDFIEVRSKRQLLREQREQREKENKAKSMESRAREQVAKKQHRSSVKAGLPGVAGVASSSKNSIKRRSVRSTETAATKGRISMPSLPAGAGTTPMVGATATSTSSDAFLTRISTSPKPGQATSASNVVHMESGNLAGSAHDSHSSEQSSTTAAWGGQWSNQEVVSFTQIQLEEAMKPFRFEGPSSESIRMCERAMMELEPGIPRASVLTLEKAPAPGPISSLLAGEKIQFGAVTSPTLIPSSSSPPSPLSVVRIGSPLGLRSDPSHIPSHSNRHVANFLESGGDVTFTSKGKRASGDDDFQGEIVDLEAEAEAAASAVAAAAISSEDLVGSHSSTRVSVLDGGGAAVVVGSNVDAITKSSGLPVTRPVVIQTLNNVPMDNPITVALPADLSVETPPTLFQGSSNSLPASSGVMLQSLPGGAPPFPCLEMGPMLGGPIFTFGPREDASLVSLEPGLTGWQQRHLGTPDSFYGAPPFMSPAGLPSIQGHPHMLVYANPFTPVGQFGQLGVSFMGTAYHPSGKQPDWAHIPLPSSSPGVLGLNDGDMNVGSNGMMASQHANGASSPSPAQRMSVAGSSVVPVAVPPNLFDAGLSASFQIPHMDGWVQSHWSKAPAPPVHNVAIAGPAPSLQNVTLSGPDLGLTMQPHHSRALSSQLGHLPHLMSSGFRPLPVLKPVTSSSFASADAGAQFLDELGLGDSITVGNVGNALLSDVGGRLCNMGHASSSASVGISGTGHRLSQSSQGHLNGANSSSNGELVFGTSSPDESRSDLEPLELQIKNHARMGSSGLRPNSLPFAEQRASQQGLARDSLGTEWSGSNHRKGGSGRMSTADRGAGGSALSSKLKQIYVAKPAAASRKLSAAFS